MSYYRHGWQAFKDLERKYLQTSEEQRLVDRATTKLTKQFFEGQAVSQKSKNPQGGMYGRVLLDEGGTEKVQVLTKSGATSKCTREYLELYIRETKQ